MASRRIITIFISIFSLGCSGGSGYTGVLVNGMDQSGMADVRVVARSSPPSADLTCRVRETKSGPQGKFQFADLCRNQSYSISLPSPTLHLSGTNVIGGSESTEEGKHQVWQAPDGLGVYRLSGGQVQPLPTFADVIRDETPDGQPVVYPALKPTGKVITIGPGEYLIIAGKNWAKKQRIHPLTSDKGRRRLASGFITDHVYIGAQWPKGKLERVEAKLDVSKVREVLIRGEGMRFIAHDAVPAGRYALLGDGDARVTIIDFGSGQAPAK